MDKLQFFLLFNSPSFFFSQSGGKGSLTVSLCQNLPAGSLHVTILKAMGLPPPKSDPTPASGGLGKMFVPLSRAIGIVM